MQSAISISGQSRVDGRPGLARFWKSPPGHKRPFTLSSTISQDCTDNRKVRAGRLSALREKHTTHYEHKKRPLDNECGPRRQEGHPGPKIRKLLFNEAFNPSITGMEWVFGCHSCVMVAAEPGARARYFNSRGGSHESHCKLDKKFLELMGRRGWDKHPEEATREMIAYDDRKKLMLIYQDRLVEVQSRQKSARAQYTKLDES